ncbi:MAG: asparagine synthase (glutamine-hydrolyzing) [Defluviitaleaceae bacterium]|nr:asparagine synthase (glutamine-hydrolyzing) [Defluviitaleaceae bacterium]
MAGIAGIVNYRKTAAEAADICQNMLEGLKVRGKDVTGTYISEEVCLVHTAYKAARDGKQPTRAFFGQKAYVIVFDGEIYNREELRTELAKLDHRFQDDSDAAVALHGYIAWGAACLDKFVGMFAFAVWDSEKLFMARDRLGLRPLFYSVGRAGLVIGSNLKAVLAHPDIHPIINANGVQEILLLGPGKTPGSGLFKDVYEIMPGHFAIYSAMGFSQTRYWQLKARPHRESFNETLDNIRTLLKNAVKMQTGGDVVTLLSGGLDSSLMAAMSGARRSFSLDYIGNDRHFVATEFQPESDGNYITQMVRHLGLSHKEVVLGSDELADALEAATAARGYPGMADVDASLLLFLQKVGETASVALSGEGADEIFGGYPWFQDENKLALIDKTTFPWAQSIEYRASFISPEIQLSPPEEFIKTCFGKTPVDILYDDSPTEARTRKMFMLCLSWFLQTLSARNDAMSAAAGVTVRVPFLDHRLVEYLYNVPWELKNHKDREKGLLREALKGALPEAVLWRKKSPFPKTHNPAYLSLVRDKLAATPYDAPIFQFVSRKSLGRLLKEDSGVNWYGQLMAHPQTMAYFLQINAWMKEYSVKVE